MKRRIGYISLAILSGGTLGFWLGAISKQRYASFQGWINNKRWPINEKTLERMRLAV